MADMMMPTDACGDWSDNGTRTFGWASTDTHSYLFPKCQPLSSMQAPVPPRGQCYALMHIRGPTGALRSDGWQLRILGAFETMSDAQRASNDIHATNADADEACYMFPLDTPFYVGPDMEESNRSEEVLQSFRQSFSSAQSLSDKDSVDEPDAHVLRDPPYNLDTVRRLNCVGEWSDAKEETTVKDISYLWSPCGQRYFTFAAAHRLVGGGRNHHEQQVIQDDWAVTCFGAFGTVSDANAYVSDVLQHERKDCGHMCVVGMGEWIALDFLASGYLKYITNTVHATEFGRRLHGDAALHDEARNLWEKYSNAEFIADLQVRLSASPVGKRNVPTKNNAVGDVVCTLDSLAEEGGAAKY